MEMTGLWTAVENRPLAIGQADLEGRFSHRRPQPLKNADAFFTFPQPVHVLDCSIRLGLTAATLQHHLWIRKDS